MAILGDDTTPTNGYFFDDFGNCQFWDNGQPMPPGGGIVTDFYAYMGGDGASATVQFVIWVTGAIGWQSGNIVVPGYSRVNTGQAWQHVAVPNVYIGAGTTNLGWWTNGNVIWTCEHTSQTDFQRSVAGGPTPIAFGGSEGTGRPGVYIVYTPGGIGHTRRSGAWNTGVASVKRSSAWNQGLVQGRRSGGWVPAT